MKTAFTILLHAHDYVWQSDWPSKTRHDTTRLLWNLIILQSREGTVVYES